VQSPATEREGGREREIERERERDVSLSRYRFVLRTTSCDYGVLQGAMYRIPDSREDLSFQSAGRIPFCQEGQSFLF
jgi:hypothetical protein